jgi:hypothetical protein
MAHAVWRAGEYRDETKVGKIQLRTRESGAYLLFVAGVQMSMKLGGRTAMTPKKKEAQLGPGKNRSR